MRELEDALEREIGFQTLADMDMRLFERVAGYLNHLEHAASEYEGIDAEVLVAEHKYVRDTITHLFDIRLKKITCLDDSNLIADEQKIFKQVYSLKMQYRKELLEPILRGEYAYEREGFIRARVTSSIPAFLDGELHTYGPYNVGDVDHFPEKVYNILVRHGLVE